MLKLKKTINFLLVLFVIVGVFCLIKDVNAAVDVGANYIGNDINLSDTNPITIAARVINVGMMFLGIIAVGIIIFAGWKWMSSQGNAEQVESAQKILKAGVIGLAIILAAWGIATFIMSQLMGATGGSGTGNNQGCTGPNCNLPGCTGPGCAGSSCDDNTLMSGCQAGNCQTGLICDVNSNCTCQPGAGSPCGTMVGTVCTATTTCATGLTCDNNSCTCIPCTGPNCGSATPCDGDTNTPTCDANNNLCPNGHCSVNDNCTCQPGAFGDFCDGDNATPTCEADNNKCDANQGLQCDPTSCTCIGSPIITDVSPLGGFCNQEPDQACDVDADCDGGNGEDTCNTEVPNGAPGNIISIHGYNFGNPASSTARLPEPKTWWQKIKKTLSLEFGLFKAVADDSDNRLIFLGDENNAADDKLGLAPATVNSNCANSWTNTEIITVVPSGVTLGPIKVVNGWLVGSTSTLAYDQTNDAIGPQIPNFIPNVISRPGICRIFPDNSEMGHILGYYGVNLSGNGYFGNYQSSIPGAAPSFTNSLGGSVKVPNINPGDTSTFVKSGVSKSNYLNFRKNPEPITGPSISSFEPTYGPVGQYVTIRGTGFGNSQGTSQVYFSLSTTTETLASYDFPPVCLQSVWNDNQVIVKVPTGLSNGAYKLRMQIGTWNIDTGTNKFTASSSAPLAPSVCKIEPNRGPANSPVSLWGEYFGNINANGVARFYNNQDATTAIADDDNGANKLDVSVPANAITGPVRVVRNGLAGNGLNFSVGACVANADCGSGLPTCCPIGTPKQGRCVLSLFDSNNGCYSSIPNSVFEWKFSTQISCAGANEDECAALDFCTWDAESGCLPCSSFNNLNDCRGPAGSPTTCCWSGSTCQGGSQDNSGLCLSTTYSCAYKGSGTNSCPTGFCPNSPGQCSAYPGNNPVVLSTCDHTCNSVPGCSGNNCLYDQESNKCIHKTQICDADIPFTYALGGQDYTTTKTCNSNGKWEITVTTSCPAGWLTMPGGKCQSSSSCNLCSSGLNCKAPADNFVCGDDVTYDGGPNNGTYKTVLIGDQCWFKENLNAGIAASSTVAQINADQGSFQKYCYNNSSSNCDNYGGLYQWHTAMALPQACDNNTFVYTGGETYSGTNGCFVSFDHQGICPPGWHVPTDRDWHTLELISSSPATEANCDGQRINTNSYLGTPNCPPAAHVLQASAGFKAKKAGYISNGASYYLGSTGGFWSSTPKSSNGAFKRLIYTNWSSINRSVAPRGSESYSVRCVRNANICVSPNSLCSNGSTCAVTGVNVGKCVANDQAKCECCCEIGQSQRDCCAPLTCEGTCGNDNTADNSGFGRCSGCLDAGSTQIEHDQACNCSNSSGKYCKNDGATGYCDDCTALNMTECTEHATSCCWDDKNNICHGGDGQVITSDSTNPSYGHCAYYGCDLSGGACDTQPAIYSLATTSLKIYNSTSTCQANCDPTSVCSLITTESVCNGTPNCCYDVGTSTPFCRAGTELTSGPDAGRCAYYNCQTGTNADQCATSTPAAVGTFSSLTSCAAGCNIPHLGASCSGNTGTSTTCNTSICGAPFACTNAYGVLTNSFANTDCGFCCCDPNNTATNTCAILGPNLTCEPNRGPCGGNDRGLCCGCESDAGCGQTSVNGCGLDACCRNRPSVIAASTTPQGVNVCRNAMISVPFDQKMDITSFVDGFLLLQSLPSGSSCPAGTSALSLNDIRQYGDSWLARIYYKVKDIFIQTSTVIARVLNLNLQAMAASVFGNVLLELDELDIIPFQLPDPNGLGVYCAVTGVVTSEQTSQNSILYFKPTQLLAGNSDYYAVVKGQSNLNNLASSTPGVLSFWGIGMAGNGYANANPIHARFGPFSGQSFLHSYIWKFHTLAANNQTSGICAVDHVVVTPAGYIFQKNNNDLNENDLDANHKTFDTVKDKDRVYTAKAMSVGNQILQPTPGYDWNWLWTVGNSNYITTSTAANLPEEKIIINVKPGISDKSTTVKAEVSMDGLGNVFLNGDNSFKEVPVTIFVCSNPWPSVNNADEWQPLTDTTVCNAGGGSCNSYNYELYYCRDAGNPDDLSDDLPALASDNNVITIGQSSRKVCSDNRLRECSVNSDCNGGLCVWDILKESYFFREVINGGNNPGGLINPGSLGTSTINSFTE